MNKLPPDLPDFTDALDRDVVVEDLAHLLDKAMREAAFLRRMAVCGWLSTSCLWLILGLVLWG